MNFGEALQAMKEGKKVTRSIWGGFWYLARNARLLDTTADGIYQHDNTLDIIVAVLKDGGVAPAMPYQQDLLAEDWQIVD